jgi:zinc transport system substrate-binding protein
VRTRIILILVLGAAFAGCGGASSDPEETSVVASFYPLAYVAEQVGGSAVTVRNLTPPGAEPHDLEVSPGDVRVLDDADLVLLLGEGFQPQLEDVAGDGDGVLRALDTPGLRLLEGNDPHVWLDPLRFALIVEHVGATLGRPAAAERLAGRLRGLDREYRDRLADCERREIVTSHDAFSYLASRYGLRQISIAGQSPEGEPTPQDLERAVDAVRETGATTVFVEPLVSPRVAETVAREAGAATAVLNPLEGLTGDEQARGDDYFSLMRANLAALRKALGCR